MYIYIYVCSLSQELAFACQIKLELGNYVI